MTLAYSCVLIAIFIPLILTAYAKGTAKGYDNRSPRDFLARLEGRGKRANAAQMNAYEAFPPFAAGVIIAHLSGAPQAQIDLLAVLFVVFRVFYSICYVIDQHVLRTLIWFCAFACTIGLFIISF